MLLSRLAADVSSRSTICGQGFPCPICLPLAVRVCAAVSDAGQNL